ncbi:hypothetical protein [Enterococcus faecalis]|uniref:hypothetical protein n=1 Tax=Enterococcus faecalis TaxID=1351 RepID=UPI00155A267D|nr:hypothetical protein [Enterococcus faecalis]EGO2793422.1 hypothetical protein [Enterococcus faecalis]EJR1554045.1 hypothetical protein [Enterococcus faecalis]NRC94911.1 hypothetical protein [Enterococcus faecalis]NSU41576.1 hypothetical protein [Enterococcus faecalis]NSV14952.1 hypothetical protein [Enterococcus faecalis]
MDGNNPKEIKLIVATHGGLAKGIIDTGTMMLGDLSDITYLVLLRSLKIKRALSELQIS